jgi:hypothetical protein
MIFASKPLAQTAAPAAIRRNHGGVPEVQGLSMIF